MATPETAGPLTKEQLIEQTKGVLTKVAPMFAGQPGEVCGAVLLNLVATYLANYHPAKRDGLLAAWLNGLPDMIRAADRIRAATRREPPPEKLDS